VAHDFRADPDQLLFESRHRPIFDRRQRQDGGVGTEPCFTGCVDPPGICTKLRTPRWLWVTNGVCGMSPASARSSSGRRH
jgi:hypothetical protein